MNNTVLQLFMQHAVHAKYPWFSDFLGQIIKKTKVKNLLYLMQLRAVGHHQEQHGSCSTFLPNASL